MGAGLGDSGMWREGRASQIQSSGFGGGSWTSALLVLVLIADVRLIHDRLAALRVSIDVGLPHLLLVLVGQARAQVVIKRAVAADRLRRVGHRGTFRWLTGRAPVRPVRVAGEAASSGGRVDQGWLYSGWPAQPPPDGTAGERGPMRSAALQATQSGSALPESAWAVQRHATTPASRSRPATVHTVRTPAQRRPEGLRSLRQRWNADAGHFRAATGSPTGSLHAR